MMTETKHTPEPWTQIGNKIEGQDGETIAYITAYQFLTPRQKANARLIAAAPELFKALKDIVDYWDSVVPELLVNEHHKNGRAAIAKATGETQ